MSTEARLKKLEDDAAKATAPAATLEAEIAEGLESFRKWHGPTDTTREEFLAFAKGCRCPEENNYSWVCYVDLPYTFYPEDELILREMFRRLKIERTRL